MPLYQFSKVSDPDVKDSFYFSMKDAPELGAVWKDENGIEWKREFTVPYAASNSQIDPNNANDFVQKTAEKKGTYGNLLDASRELSEKRAKEHGGVDPVQKKYFDEYKKARHGVQHLEERKQQKVDRDGYSISHN